MLLVCLPQFRKTGSELHKPGKIWMSSCDSKMLISPVPTVFLDDDLMSAN